MKLIVVGAAGRMGRTLTRIVTESEGVTVTGAIDRDGVAEIGKDAGVLAGVGELGVTVTTDPLPLFAKADGVLDFTVPAATVGFAEIAAQARIAHIIGTTGLTADDDERIAAAARHAPIVKSGNMSLGVNLLAVLVRQAAQALDPDFDIEVLEMHHRAKVDAPSGTALMLGRAAAAGREIDAGRAFGARARRPSPAPRKRGDIGFATLRGGSVIGEHSVIFAGNGETIELSHKATDRALFARGAVKAALWARDRKPGLYSMADVLGSGVVSGPAFLPGGRSPPRLPPDRINRRTDIWTACWCSSATDRANGTSRISSPAGTTRISPSRASPRRRPPGRSSRPRVSPSTSASPRRSSAPSARST